jgi:hypothetical protein
MTDTGTGTGTGRGTWVDQALREHEEHAAPEHAGPQPAAASDREQQVLDRIDKARRRRPRGTW